MNPFEVLYNNEQVWKTVDHRVDGWLFMSSMVPPLLLIFIAIAGFICGPIYMKSRQPLNVGPVMATYNVFIVAFNVYIACQLVIGGHRKQYDWFCEPIDSSVTDKEEMRIVRAMHLSFICKMMEMLDTFFLIARKKSITENAPLVIHHAFMASGGWVVARWMPSGSAFAPTIFINSAHAIMYAYFTLVVFLPSLLKSPFVKYAFLCFLILQMLVVLAYALLVIWIQCALFLPIAYSGLVLIGVMIIHHFIKFLLDYQRAPKGNGIMSFVIEVAEREAKALKYSEEKRKNR